MKITTELKETNNPDKLILVVRRPTDGPNMPSVSVQMPADIACLFAAAPELLEACSMALGDMEQEYGEDGHEDIRPIRSAIARATTRHKSVTKTDPNSPEPSNPA